MKNLEELKIWVSPLSHEIYAGFVDKDGTVATNKVNVTEMAITAVMLHLDVEQCEYGCRAGRLRFISTEDAKRKEKP
ncbi:hypothetical protein [Sporomusa aerivorans]|uniref:DUF7446 family protein n=1 Tax=Sporomusa aerivorans TaxID=204936 RepID=UPI00352B4865